ncbi:MAG: glucose 1-dehydrogenase [Desulfovibrionales bacterium]
MHDITKLDLTGQCAVVTGGSSGIGAAAAKALASAGAGVVVNYRSSRDKAQEIVDEIAASGGKAMAVQADVGREEDVKALFAEAAKQWGRLDILVSNAGLQRDARIVDMSLEDWNLVIGTNLTGSFLCAREAARLFLTQQPAGEGGVRGKIIFMSSVHEIIPWAGHANYAASKGGLSLLMRSMAQELGEKKIRINSIAPGAIKTQINEDAWNDPASRERLLQLIPYNRLGKPEDIARAVVWLGSEASDYVHGATLVVDGGMTLYPKFQEGG